MYVDVERIAELTRAGWSAARIAAEVHCSDRTVHRARKLAGVAKPPARWLTPAEVEIAEQMLADGCPVVEIERTFGTSIGGLSKRFGGRGWTPTECGSWAGMYSKLAREARA